LWIVFVVNLEEVFQISLSSFAVRFQVGNSGQLQYQTTFELADFHCLLWWDGLPSRLKYLNYDLECRAVGGFQKPHRSQGWWAHTRHTKHTSFDTQHTDTQDIQKHRTQKTDSAQTRRDIDTQDAEERHRARTHKYTDTDIHTYTHLHSHHSGHAKRSLSPPRSPHHCHLSTQLSLETLLSTTQIGEREGNSKSQRHGYTEKWGHRHTGTTQPGTQHPDTAHKHENLDFTKVLKRELRDFQGIFFIMISKFQ
jgi:hypothetical protein